MKYKLLALGLSLLPVSALAVQATYPAKGDSRIRYVDYSRG